MIEANLSTNFGTTSPQQPNGPLAVLCNPEMAVEAKRALLASWASDARAVPNCPALRRLDDGNLVLIDDVLDALKQLDRQLLSNSFREVGQVTSRKQGHWSRLARRWRRNHDGDDDDDPPTAPASVLPIGPVSGGGLAAAA